MQKKIILLLCLISIKVSAQELYVFSEPASNMPARSLATKEFVKLGDAGNRYTTELMFALNKNWMLHAANSFSNMYSPGVRWESAKLYAKYRFFSSDGLFTHFRMAAFAEGSYSRNNPMYDELSLDGDQSGVQSGIIATQLLHKLALSSSISFTESLQPGRFDKSFPQLFPYEAVNYSLSAGYLVLPKKYTDYNQINLNLYMELLGQKTTDLNRYFIDLAPAAQLIFNSAVKLNLGYRFQLGSNMQRMNNKSWLIGFEWLFLNALH